MPCPKVKCVLARLSRAASGRHARRSPFACCARRIPARRVSPLFVNGLMKSRTNVEPKWSSRRGSNPHAATTSRRTVGARVLRVSRSGTVQFTVQPHAFLFMGSWRRRNAVPAKVLANPCGTRHADRYISRPTRPCHLLGIGIYRARLNPVLHRLDPCDLSAGDVFRFASRDV